MSQLLLETPEIPETSEARIALARLEMIRAILPVVYKEMGRSKYLEK